MHETTDVGLGFMWGAVAICSGTLLVCALAVMWLYPKSTLDRTLQLPLPLYPQPRLQPDPPADMQQLRAAELRVLDSAGWVDRERGIAHIPISQAMQEIAREGIPAWPKQHEDSQ